MIKIPGGGDCGILLVLRMSYSSEDPPLIPNSNTAVHRYPQNCNQVLLSNYLLQLFVLKCNSVTVATAEYY